MKAGGAMRRDLFKNEKGVVMLEYVLLCSLMVFIFAACFAKWFYNPIDGYPEKGSTIRLGVGDSEDEVIIPPGKAFYDYMQRVLTGVALPIP